MPLSPGHGPPSKDDKYRATESRRRHSRFLLGEALYYRTQTWNDKKAWEYLFKVIDQEVKG